jgi:predicted permease
VVTVARCAGPLLLSPGNPAVAAFAAALPWELQALLSAVRAVAETAALLGSLTLGLQLIVLGASLLPSHSEGEAGAPSGRAGWAAVVEVLAPEDRWSMRQLIATSTVRLVLLPACTLAMVHSLHLLHLLPPCSVCVGALLVMSCMPSAQNLVLLLNLTPETATLAPTMARLLLRQILLSAAPMTVWISIFMTYLGLPVST